MSDIFEEVEEGYRQDKLAEAWKRFGPFVWAAAFLLIGAVAWFEWNKSELAQQQSERIQVLETARSALEAGNYEAAQAGFRELANSDEDVAVLSRHLLADTLYKGSGDVAGAADELAAAAASDAPLGKLARLKSAYLAADQMNLSELEAALGGLQDEDGPLGVLALELVAAKAFTEGDFKRARDDFSYLRIAANAPQGVVQRAELALSVIPVVQDSDGNVPAVDLLPSQEEGQAGAPQEDTP